MKKLIFLLVAIFHISFGMAKEYEIKVGEFSKLNVTDSINVVYKPLSGAGGKNAVAKAVFSTSADLADALIFNNNKGTLHISVGTEYVENGKLPTVYVYSDFLESVQNGGLGTVTVENPAPSAMFKAKLIGNGSIIVKNLNTGSCDAVIETGCGSIVLGGKTRKCVFKLVGTGLIQADRLESSVVDCKIMGSGSIGCWPIDKLSVTGLGSTKIYYKGDPTTIKKRGGGTLIKIE